MATHTAMSQGSRIFVAGHRGMVGAAIVRQLQARGFSDLSLVDKEELDLRNQAAVHDWFMANRPEYVFLAAGTVGGILANATRPAEFIYDNLMMHGTVVHAAYLSGVRKLLCLGSSCIYPRDCPQPMREDYLLSGKLEPTNEPYAIAKIAGLKLCSSYRRQYGCDFISAMPTNLYGPNDNFDLHSSHALAAMIRKFHEARVCAEKAVTLWGTGSPRREFLHVDDLATACVYLMESYSEEAFVNVGTGVDLTIRELAEKVRGVIYPEAEIRWDRTKPDGTPRKLLDISRLRDLGWRSKVSLDEGIESTYSWFVEHHH